MPCAHVAAATSRAPRMLARGVQRRGGPRHEGTTERPSSTDEARGRVLSCQIVSTIFTVPHQTTLRADDRGRLGASLGASLGQVGALRGRHAGRGPHNLSWPEHRRPPCSNVRRTRSGPWCSEVRFVRFVYDPGYVICVLNVHEHRTPDLGRHFAPKKA